MGFNLLIIDDNAMFQRHARRFLEQRITDINVVETASEAEKGLKVTKALNPDVILLDLSMPDQGGLSVLSDLRQAAPDAHIIVLTRHDDPLYSDEALSEGANAFVSKLHMTKLPDEIERARADD